MKKIMAFMLCLAALGCTAGCGKAEDELRGTVEEAGTTAVEETTEAAEEATEAAEAFEFGAVESNKYENKFIGIGCELSADWTFATDEEIKAQNNLTLDTIDEDVAAQIEAADIIYDMMATNADGMSNINLNLEKIGVANYMLYDVADVLNSQMDTIKGIYAEYGYEDITAESTTITIGDESFDGMNITGTAGGVVMNQTLFGIKCGGQYLANVTITTFGEELTTQEVVDCFYIAE